MDAELKEKISHAADDLFLSMAYEVAACSSAEEVERKFNTVNPQQFISIKQLRQLLDDVNNTVVFNTLRTLCQDKINQFESALSQASRIKILAGLLLVTVERKACLSTLPKIPDCSVLKLRAAFREEAKEKVTTKGALNILKLEECDLKGHLDYADLVSQVRFNSQYTMVRARLNITRVEHLKMLLSMASRSAFGTEIKQQFESGYKEIKEVLRQTSNIINSNKTAVKDAVRDFLTSQSIAYDSQTLAIIFDLDKSQRDEVIQGLLNITYKDYKRINRSKDSQRGYQQKTVEIPIEGLKGLDEIFSSPRGQHLSHLYQSFFAMNMATRKKCIANVSEGNPPAAWKSINFKIESSLARKLSTACKKHGVTFKALTWAIISQKLKSGITLAQDSQQMTASKQISGEYEFKPSSQRFGPGPQESKKDDEEAKDLSRNLKLKRPMAIETRKKKIATVLGKDGKQITVCMPSRSRAVIYLEDG